jgi:hypothetical protein
VWSTIIVFDQPKVEIGLQLVERVIDLFAERDPVELVEHSAMETQVSRAWHAGRACVYFGAGRGSQFDLFCGPAIPWSRGPDWAGQGALAAPLCLVRKLAIAVLYGVGPNSMAYDPIPYASEQGIYFGLAGN